MTEKKPESFLLDQRKLRLQPGYYSLHYHQASPENNYLASVSQCGKAAKRLFDKEKVIVRCCPISCHLMIPIQGLVKKGFEPKQRR